MAEQVGLGAEESPRSEREFVALLKRVEAWRAGLHEFRVSLGSPARAASVTALAAFVLTLAGSFLTSHTGYGLEDWLGWGLAGPDAPAPALLKLWTDVGLLWLAQADLSFDTLVLLPCYAGLFTRLIWSLGQTLLRDLRGREPGDGPPLEWLLLPLSALAFSDLAENLLGLSRVDGVPWWGSLLQLPMLALSFLLWHVALPVLRRWRWRALLGGAGLALLTLWLAGGANAPACIGTAGPEWFWPPAADLAGYACATHHGKRWLLMLTALWLLLLGLAWIFAVLRRDGQARGQDQRTLLRSAVGDMLLRSRYVLIAVLLLALLVLVMDQARDLAYATLGAGPLPGLFAHGMAAAAAWLLAFCLWLWTRSACEVVAAGRTLRTQHGVEDDFARYLARLLGMSPLLMFALLALGVVRDGIAGAYANSILNRPIDEPLQIALAAAALSLAHVLLAGAFAWQRGRQQDLSRCYYNARADVSWLFPRSGLYAERYTLGRHVKPMHLLVLALAGFAVARLADMSGALPSLAQAEIAFALAFWVCVFGWLSLQELRTAVPWVLGLVVLVGVLGGVGQDSRHIVWRPLLHAEPLAVPANDGLRLAATLLLAALVALAYGLVIVHAGMRARGAQPFSEPVRFRRPGEPRRVPGLFRRLLNWGRNQVFDRFKLAGMLFALWLAALGVMAGADRLIDEREQLAPAAWQADPRPSLELALRQWLESLCKEEKACSEEAGSAELPVYLIATAGGGIRATAWTADLLQSWQEQDPQFAARTFAISGVSGGAVGAAVFRACQADPPHARACIQRFMQRDLVAPLLSAWMFEDVLGNVLPSGVCSRQPGCGFLSRAAWFEAGLEQGAPELRRNLFGAQLPAHRPHLLLNSTWVESGERAIASDIALNQDFPGARDQLDILRHDLPLSTAAHNAARFPYTNAIGELQTRDADCRRRASASAPLAGDAALQPCGHLADGGYYDNSGMATLADVMRGLSRCLSDPVAGSACGKLPHRTWLAQHLRVNTLMLRNTPRLSNEPVLQCAHADEPHAADVRPKAADGCLARTPLYQPQMPACAAGNRLYTDALGPPLAVLAGSGIGAHGRRDEALMFTLAVPPGMLQPVAIDLLQQGVHFPLGWHLSGVAATNIEEQAGLCTLGSLQSAAQR